MDVEARTVLTLLETVNGQAIRQYYQLPLEISQVAFMPLTWTLVHSIGKESPMWAMKEEELRTSHAEVLVQMKAFDETYNQVIYSRYSYPVAEWVWGAKFKPSFNPGQNGETVVFVDKIHEWELVK